MPMMCGPAFLARLDLWVWASVWGAVLPVCLRGVIRERRQGRTGSRDRVCLYSIGGRDLLGFDLCEDTHGGCIRRGPLHDQLCIACAMVCSCRQSIRDPVRCAHRD